MRIVLIISLIFISIIAKSQIADNVVDIKKNDIKLKLGFEFKHLYQVPTYNTNSLVDPEIEKNRLSDTNDYYSPFMHSALYFSINYEINFKEKYRLNFTTFFEQRNWSLGVNSKYFYNYYPQFSFMVADTIVIKKASIPIKAKMGNMHILDEMQTGLKAYNVDVQGLNFEAKYKRFGMNVLYIASLDFNVGLCTDEFIRAKLQYNFDLKNTDALLSTALTYEYNNNRFDENSNTNLGNNSNVGLIVKYNISDRFNYYFITEYKISNSISNNFQGSNMAFVLAMQYNYKTNAHHITVNPKLRYYGHEFRKLDYDKSYYLYRNSNPLFDGGHYFYALKNYYRPVSQYALYAEYYDDYGLYSLELNLNWDWKISRKIGHKLDVEIFQFFRNSTDNGNYYTNVYFSSFLYYKFAESFKGGLYISNKQMNRDVLYQTFYQMQYPFFGFHISYDGAFEFGK